MDFIDHRSTAKFIFKTSATDEKARIDDSGNILTGKTSSNFSTAGAEVRNLGNIWATRDDGVPLALNRLNSDGTIAQFYKDGGSIGVVAAVSGDLAIYSSASGHTGLRFGDGWIGSTNNAGTLQNGTVNLGTTSYRWNDLYLAGDANIGGNATITGDLTVSGTTTTINTATLDVEDKNITLNYGAGDTSASADGAGITIQDAVDASNNATLLWDQTNSEWDFSHDVTAPNLNISNWDAAYSWGDHSAAGYLTSFSETDTLATVTGRDATTTNAISTGAITSSGAISAQNSLTIQNQTAYGVIEVGGVSGGFIDIKRPFSDDYDLRLLAEGDGGVINVASGELTIQRAGSAKLATSSSGIEVTGDITVSGTVDGRDVAIDGTKLDGIEASADVTDTANVTDAGALMDSELASEASVKALNQGVATTNSPAFAGLTVDTNTLHVDSTNNRVGIGTISPAIALDIVDTSADVQMRVYKNDGTKNTRLTLTADDSGAKIHYRDADNAGALRFNNNLGEVMRIPANTTRVGIGVSNPSTKLEVDGVITATGIDVTGTVTADGLTVDGEGTFTKNQAADTAVEVSNLGTAGATTTASFIVSEVAGTPKGWFRRYRDGTATTAVGFSDKLVFEGAIGSTPTNRMEIASNGDISFYDDSGSAKLFWDASAESLGIGTSSPSKTLDIEGNIRAKNTAGSSGAEIDITSGGTWRFRSNATSGTNSYGLDIVKGSAGTDVKMSINSSGNVGIGTSSIDLTSSGRTVVQVEGSSNALLNLTDGTSRLYLHQKGGTSGADIWNSADSYMRFATNDTERMRIDASGNVGIGTSSPESQLQVNVGTNLNLGINEDSSTVRLSAYNDAANANVPMTINSSSTRFDISGSEAIRIDSSGNLLVGRSSTGAAATDNGHIFYGTGQHYIFSNATECVRFYETSGSGQQVGSISITSSATTFNTSSDQRLKENIADADDAGSKVDAIQVRKFDWIADGSHQDYGMVAQELQTVAPEAVSGDADSEDMMGVDYSKLVPMMLKEIQSLRARVAQLEGAN